MTYGLPSVAIKGRNRTNAKQNKQEHFLPNIELLTKQ